MKLTTINPESVIEIRGQKVMLDAVVATSLGVPTSKLNENAGRSPKWELLRKKEVEDKYRFQLTKVELFELKSQNAIALNSNNLPWVYTQLGCNHFGTSLSSEKARELAMDLSLALYAMQTGAVTPNPAFMTKGDAALDCGKYAEGIKRAYLALGCGPSKANVYTAQELVQQYPQLPNFSARLPEFNVADVQERHVNPTTLADILKLKSAQVVNKLLETKGLQVRETFKRKNSKGEMVDKHEWVPTDKAKNEGLALFLDTKKKYTCGRPIMQLDWYKDRLVKHLQ